MEFLDPYLRTTSSNQFAVSAMQGSCFAKQVAGDFNPIHDADSKRFCVPGDLLFAIALKQYGLHQNMTFRFLDLIKADTLLNYQQMKTESTDTEIVITSDAGKPVLGLEYGGTYTKDSSKIEQLLKNYVAFSGHNFPDILVPLMKQHKVMINPQRPLVIYQSMAFKFDTLDFENLDISLETTSMEVAGKRGTAQLHFALNNDGVAIGSGIKYLVLSGLREYDEPAIDQMCVEYEARRNA